MQQTSFAQNLRHLCNQYPSVAHVCRSININRQQFNKYLSGAVLPSRHNLEQICRFFKVHRDDFDLPCEEFQQKFGAGTIPAATTIDLNGLIDSIPNAAEQLKRYQGYYYSHFHALGYPGYLVRSLVYLHQHQGRFYTKSVEHLWDKAGGSPLRHRFKYHGIAFYLGDRIFITEHEMLAGQAICHTILYPSYRSSLDYLSGITTGVGSLNTHPPKSTRVEFQYLGKTVNLREVLDGCGLFGVDSGSIVPEIRERVHNEISEDEFMLTALGQ